MSSPFHEGELLVQRLAGEAEMADRNGAMIGGRIMGGALPFLRQQGMAVLASQDQSGALWCSILFGETGFLCAGDGLAVDIDLEGAVVEKSDPLWANIGENHDVGMLVIDLGSRRRLRINGTVMRTGEGTLRVQVQESFANCPKYITKREVTLLGVEDTPVSTEPREGESLGKGEIALLERADVLFLGTAHPTRGADASHRGGPAGFVRVLDSSTLLIPDFAGNSMFNTLGNLAVNAKMGMVVPDFVGGTTLQLTGEGETLWEDDDRDRAMGGTGRFLKFHVQRWLRLPLPRGVESKFLGYSPYNPAPVLAAAELD